MKTIRQHLESIADPELREAALRNYDGTEDVFAMIFNALAFSFNYDKTPEGKQFWQAIEFEYRQFNTPTYQQFKHLIR